jgi:hypothetical protein
MNTDLKKRSYMVRAMTYEESYKNTDKLAQMIIWCRKNLGFFDWSYSDIGVFEFTKQEDMIRFTLTWL